MENNYIHITIRRDTTENWLASNPVLQLGEITYDTDKHGLKVGDGKHMWSALPFCGADFNNLEQKLTQLINSTIADLKSELTQLIASNVIPVENTLTSTSATNALSAEQGRVLKELVDNKVDVVVISNLQNELAQMIKDNTVHQHRKSFKRKSGARVNGVNRREG